jgi:hypothetical protein
MEPHPEAGIGEEPVQEHVDIGSPNGEPEAKKPRVEPGSATGGEEGISQHVDNWFQSLNDMTAAAQPAALAATATDEGGDARRPYQDEVMHLLADTKQVQSPDGSVASLEYNDEDVISARNIPGVYHHKRVRDSSRQRDSSITRRNVSNPFLKSTTKLLESVTDLASVLSHDDCMLLGRYFWVFTLEQLEFLLSDTLEEDSDIDELIAKTARFEFTDRLRKLLLGERPAGHKPMYGRGDDYSHHRYGIDPESIASAAMIGAEDADEGLRKDVRANVSSKSFPWLDSGASQTLGAMASPMPPPLTPANMYAPQGDDGTTFQAMDYQTGEFSAGSLATAGEAAAAAGTHEPSTNDALMSAGTHEPSTNDALMCAEDMTTKVDDPEILPDAEAEADRNSSDEAAKPAAKEEPMKIEDTLAKWREAIKEYKTNGSAVADSKKFKIDGAIGVLIPGSMMNFLRSVQAETVWDFLAARRQVRSGILFLPRFCSLFLFRRMHRSASWSENGEKCAGRQKLLLSTPYPNTYLGSHCASKMRWRPFLLLN